MQALSDVFLNSRLRPGFLLMKKFIATKLQIKSEPNLIFGSKTVQAFFYEQRFFFNSALVLLKLFHELSFKCCLFFL